MRGFTLIEVLVALAVLSVAVVGTMRVFSLAVVSTGRAGSQTSTTMLAMQKIDDLRALKWSVVPGAPAIPFSDMQADLSGPVPASGGPGLALSPPNSLLQSVTGCVDYLNRSGGWVGTGSTPPAGAMFVRRWNVSARPGDANTLVLQVMVASVVADAARSRAGTSARTPGDAWLVVVRTRVSP